jgi:hypothetical protein
MGSEDLRADIAAAKDRMETRVGANREIKKLGEHLWEGETVEYMSSGYYGAGIGLVVLTDRRLLFIKDGWTSKTTEDFPLDKISSVQCQGGAVLDAGHRKTPVQRIAVHHPTQSPGSARSQPIAYGSGDTADMR